jgi:lysophospholipase L1-like esterase
MNRHVKNLGFTLVVLVIFVVVAEVVIRLATGPAVPRSSGPIAQRQEGEIEYALIPNMDREFAGARVVTNSLGIRDFRPPHKSEGKIQILVLGDSFTFGYGVPLEDSYPNLLEQRLNQAVSGDMYEVINAGVPGYDTVDEAELLDLILDHYSPRWIVVGLHPGDLTSRQELEKNTVVRTKEWLRKNSAIFSWLLRIYKTKLIKYVPPPTSALYVDPEKVFNTPQANKIKDAFRRIHATAEENGAEVVVLMVVPLLYWEHYPYEPLHEAVAGFCRDNSIYFVDPLAQFTKYDAASLWVAPNDSHYSAKANGIAAGVLSEFILGLQGEAGR